MMAVLRAWRAIPLRYWAGSVLAGLVVGLFGKMTGNMPLLTWPAEVLAAQTLPRALYGLIFLMTIVAFETHRPDRSLRGYLLASVVAATLCSVMFLAWWNAMVAMDLGLLPATPASWSLSTGFFTSLVPGTVLVMVYAHIRRSREAARRVFERQAGLTSRFQRQAESGLEAESRRYRPQDVAAEMRRIARTYAKDAAAADLALDGMIQALREASKPRAVNPSAGGAASPRYPATAGA